MTESSKQQCQETIDQLREQLEAHAHFEDLVFHLTPENFEEAKTLMTQFQTEYVQKLIYKAGDCCVHVIKSN